MPIISTAQTTYTPAQLQKISARSAHLVSTSLEQKIRVIVELKMLDSVQSGSRSPTTLKQQRLSIAKAQSALINKAPTQHIEVNKQYKTIPSIVLTVDQEGLRQLLQSDSVVSIEEDEIVFPTLLDTVPLIGANNVYNLGVKEHGKAIVVMDTGVESYHPFLQNRVVHEACYSTTTMVPYVATGLCPNGEDEMEGVDAASSDICVNYHSCNHGTHVAGIAAGAGDDFSGVAKHAKIIAIQVFTKVEDPELCRFGQTCLISFLSDHLSAFENILKLSEKYDIAALNISLGGGSYFTECDAQYPTYRKLIQAMRDKGIATITAAGNEGASGSTNFPGCLSNVVTVGSTTKNDTLSWFSNNADWVNLLAPGSRITSSVINGEYGAMSGTSMAAPHVAGAFALLKSAKPLASVDAILSALIKTGVNVENSLNEVVGKRIQIDAALNELLNPKVVNEDVVMVDDE